GQHYVSSGAEEIPSQLLFRLHHLVDFLLHRAAADELMDKHVLGLPDAEGAVGRLIFHSRVPPPIEVDDVRSCGEIESRAACFDGEHEERDAFVLLKPTYQILALPDLGLAVPDEGGAPEHGIQECGEWCGRLLELREDERLLLPSSQHFYDIAQARELAAVLLSPCAIAKPLRGMVADLLQPNEEREDNASAFDAVDVFQLVGKIVHCLLV